MEREWYDWWEASGYFTPSSNQTNSHHRHSLPPFSMVYPPPNVTGSLHIGHALTAAVEDALCRYKRMKGHDVLWIPGVDHAGISTQVVVEKKIAREMGITRHDLGRERFLDEVWKWKEEHGHRIVEQMRGMGVMTDWSRSVFTLDEPRSKAVTEAFVRLFDDGLIYRANRLVNWCPALNTALSDIEVEMVPISKRTKIAIPSLGGEKHEFGVIHTFKYRLEGNGTDGDQYIAVSTTRLETMLGDTAIAVHPEDERYRHMHGKYVVHPFSGRRIPIVCDAELVDMSLGTGAVKITPAHSFVDFECSQRHNLEFINVFQRDGTIDADAVGEEFRGMNRFNVRHTIATKLKQLGLYVSCEDHAMELPICSRSKDVVEPMAVPQWFLKCDQMAHRSRELVDRGELNIHPPNHRATWDRWLDSVRDWCISRQLWWGHRIPAYKIVVPGQSLTSEDNDLWVAARSIEEAHNKVEERYPKIVETGYELQQDDDVLDTWFSSGIYPLSTLGWPDDTAPDLERFYPLDVMETGADILFFWVARMTMLCTYLHKDKLPPFRDIYLHAMVRDAQGRKMSKSLGNVIDPIDIMRGITLEELKQQVIDNTNVSAGEIKTALKVGVIVLFAHDPPLICD